MDLDLKYMQEAFKEADRAKEKGEIPVGAIIVCDGQIIARAHNLTECLNDPTAHAEMQAITAATSQLGGKYLNQCTLYVTLEPCPMCAGALYWCQLGSLVYGASDPKRGFTTLAVPILHPKTKVKGGVMEHEAGAKMSDYFKERR